MSVLLAYDHMGRDHDVSIEVRIGWIGATPVLAGKDEDRNSILAWNKAVREAGEMAGRRQVVAEMRARGEEAPLRRKSGSRFAARCSYCLRVSDDMERDHIVPFSAGGPDTPDNIVPACRECNARKRDKSLLEFVAAGGIA